MMNEFLHKQVQQMGIVNTRFGYGSLCALCNVQCPVRSNRAEVGHLWKATYNIKLYPVT
jgi:hypothetical protein